MTGVIELLDGEISQRHMLDHPFYQRWNAGELTRGELEEYSRQYYPYTLAFPTFPQRDACAHRRHRHPPVPARESDRGGAWVREPSRALATLLRKPSASTVLTRKSTTPNAATADLIATMRNLARSEKLHEALAALYAYESQIPAVSKTKIDGLAAWYGITEPRDILIFLRSHGSRRFSTPRPRGELLETLCDTPEKCEEARAAAGATVNALYRFLDDCELVPPRTSRLVSNSLMGNASVGVFPLLCCWFCSLPPRARR